MADTPVQVIGFLEELAEKALPFARRDLEELQSFARDELGLASLESWDIAWASEKLRRPRRCSGLRARAQVSSSPTQT